MSTRNKLQGKISIWSVFLLTLACLGTAPSAAASLWQLESGACFSGGEIRPVFQQSDSEPQEDDDENTDEEEEPEC